MPFTKTPGERAPEFTLTGVDNQTYGLSDITEPVIAIVFSCNHCPYVVGSEQRMIDYQTRNQGKVRLIAINSNDAVAFPDDSFEKMVERSQAFAYNFLYLHDPDQTIAAAYGAIKTPHYFLIDHDRVIRYAGRMDDNPKDAAQATTQELQDATDALLAGESVKIATTDPIGCTVKWIGKDRKFIPNDACDVILG